jgi:hypothetical protein
MRWTMLMACAGLAACQAPGGAGNDANAAAEAELAGMTVVDLVETTDENALTDPPKTAPAPDNEMSTATPGLVYYRDLPGAYWLRGSWTVRKADWFPVTGGETPAKMPARLKAFEGAAIRVDRRAILITPKSRVGNEDVMLDCKGVGYQTKEALVAAETAPGRTNADTTTREDVLHSWSIAVSERDLSRVFTSWQKQKGQVMSLICPESDPGEDEVGEYPDSNLSGAMLFDRNRMVLIYADGIVLYAERD